MTKGRITIRVRTVADCGLWSGREIIDQSWTEFNEEQAYEYAMQTARHLAQFRPDAREIRWNFEGCAQGHYVPIPTPEPEAENPGDIYQVIRDAATMIQSGQPLAGPHYLAALAGLARLAMAENQERGLPVNHDRAYCDFQQYGEQLQRALEVPIEE